MAYIGKVTAGGNTGMLVGSTLYGTCETAAATAAKVAVIAGFDTLEPGVTVHIKFTNSNTVASPTLAIKPSSSGTATTAKSITRYGTTAPGTTVPLSWQAGQVVSFTYDGTYWQMNDASVHSTTSVGSASGWSAGSVPSLSYTAKTVKSVKSWSAGSATTLGTAIAADDITAWTTNTPTAVTKKTVVTGISVAGATLTVSTGDSCTVTAGTAASLSYTARSIPNVTAAGSAPSLTTEDIACDDITAWSAGSAPSLTVTSTTVVNS